MLHLGPYLLPNLIKESGYLVHFDEEASFPLVLFSPSSLFILWALHCANILSLCAFPHPTPVWVRMGLSISLRGRIFHILVDSDLKVTFREFTTHTDVPAAVLVVVCCHSRFLCQCAFLHNVYG